MYDCETIRSSMDHFMEDLDRKAYQDCIPLKGVFELTARCNMDCNMCYIHLNERQIQEQGRELTNEEWLSIARQAKDMGMLYLTLTGGEVFVRPGFRELYEELSNMGFLVQILSNGYGVDETVMEWLEQTPPYTLRFTLYGASDETYEKVCGVKDGFTRVSHAIDLVKKTDIPFYLVSTLVKENQADLKAMHRFCREKGVEFQATASVLKSVRGAERDIEAHRIHFPEGIEIELKEFTKPERLLDVCGNYRKGFWVTWNGALQLCGFMKEPAVSLLEQNFDTAWNELLKQLGNITMPEKCIDCKYSGFCSRCPGVLSAECGSYDQVDEDFCIMAKAVYEAYHNIGRGK